MTSPMLTSRLRRLAPFALLALAAVGLEPAAGAPTGPAPKLTSAKALDADRDGSIDGFDLKFSSKLRGKARSSVFNVRVGGYRVTRQQAPKGRGLRVSVTELAGCDLGARPRVSIKGAGLKGRGGRPVRSSRVTAGRAPKGAPRIVCAVTGDSDRDGHLDGVVLTYSKKVSNRAMSAGRLPFRVDRYSVASVGRAKGRNITLALREKDEFDTDALPAVIYRAPRAKRERRFAVKSGRSRARSVTFNATRDRATARLLSASTSDADQNGLVDAVGFGFSEPVRAGAGAVAVEGAGVTAVSSGERETLSASLGEGPLGPAAQPALTLGAGDSIRDGAGNPTGSLSTRAADGAAPVVVSARTVDRGGAQAHLDGVDVTFSEPISHPEDSDGSYPLSVGGYTVTGASAADGTRIALSVAEGPGPDGGARPPVGYARGAGAPVVDAAGNEAAERTFDGPADGIVPVLLGAATLDSDVDGLVDGVRFDFSEPVVHAAQACPGCSFSLEGFTPLLAGGASGSGVIVDVSEREGGGVPNATYAPVGAGVTDPAGNPAPGRVLSTADAAPPVAVGADTADADADGRIDRLDVTFSEPVSAAPDDQAPFSLGAAGYTVDRVGGASGREVSIFLDEGSAPDTGSAPAVSYDGSAGSKLTDLNGTEHANRSYPGLTRDDAPPRFVEARTADSAPENGNGRLDAVELLYSEELAGGTDPARFSVTGHRPVSVSYLADRVRVAFTEATGPDTADRPVVAYTPNGQAGDLADVPEGPGDTAATAPGSSGEAIDGAGPVVVAARTGDADPDGVLDRVQITMSEAVKYSEGSGPAVALGAGLSVSGSSASGDTLTAVVDEPAGPAQGDLAPTVSIAAPDRVRDRAAAPNAARGGTFDGTSDGVRPVLVGARTGEALGGECGAAVVDAIVDCFRADWSEPVTLPSTANVFTGSLTPTGLLSTGGTPFSDVSVSPGAEPDRNAAATVAYSAEEDVRDLAGNFAIPTSGAAPIQVTPACEDTIDEPNDSQDVSNPPLGGSAGRFEKLCASDDDWFGVTAGADGEIEALVDANDPVAPTARIVGADGAVIAQASGAAGAAITVSASGLAVGQRYWLHVSAGSTQEGGYCVDVTPTPGETCGDGDNTAT